MGRKHLGMKRPIKQFNKACEEMSEYLKIFASFPPRGDGAKELAIQEWKTVINNVVIQLNNVKNMQIEILKGDTNE